MKTRLRRVGWWLTFLASIPFVFIFNVWAAPPTISDLSFPANVEINATAMGQLRYQDPDQDVLYARFDVLDGRYYRMNVPVRAGATAQGEMSFALRCTEYDQQITLAVTLFDAAGERSESVPFSFTCGQPPLYNFDEEQQRVLPIGQQIALNVFILDDGETALAEGASIPEGSLLGQPRPNVLTMIQAYVLPKLSGIWDQCGVGFSLAGVWVVQPERVSVSGGTLAEKLFLQDERGLMIYHGREAGNLLRQATFALWQAAQEKEPRAAQAFNVLVVGARILTLWEGELRDIEGFSESGWPNYVIIRWGALFQGITPKQMISTLAHELGHNLGLAHPGEDGLADTISDPMNLMKGSGVTPQPRAHLRASQCQRTKEALGQLQAQLSAAANPPANPPIVHVTEATVRWLSFCPQSVCSGQIELSVTAEGFLDLQSFSFALFEYSRDGKHFVEIGVDRSYQDGFRTLWDTTKLPNGTYLLRASVTDAKGVRASVLVPVTIRN